MSLILLDREEQFATVTMNRPDARNALSRALVTDFREALRDTAADPSLRALIVAGTRESNAPMNARPAISWPAVVANEATREVTAKAAMPTCSIRRRPNRSPRCPPSSSSPAKTSV